MLINIKKSNVKTIFLLVDYGENITYDYIESISTNIDNRDFIIINTNNHKEYDQINNFVEGYENFFIRNPRMSCLY